MNKEALAIASRSAAACLPWTGEAGYPQAQPQPAAVALTATWLNRLSGYPLKHVSPHASSGLAVEAAKSSRACLSLVQRRVQSN